MTYRNPKLLALAKKAPVCFRCGCWNQGQVVGAHANLQSMGKGMGHKAADVVAYLCYECHSWVDGGKDKAEKRNHEWAMAAVHSMRWVLEHHPEVFKVTETTHGA